MTLAVLWYTSLMGLIAIAGVALIVYAWRPRKPRGRPVLMTLLGLLIIVAPMNLDLFMGRLSKTHEKVTTAWIPTTVMLWMLGEPDGFAYGRVFDRFHKAPSRHGFWGWQKKSWAKWAATRIELEESDLRIQGIKISDTLAPDVDLAVINLGKALSDRDTLNSAAACDALERLGDRARIALEEIKTAAQGDNAGAECAKKLLTRLGG